MQAPTVHSPSSEGEGSLFGGSAGRSRDPSVSPEHNGHGEAPVRRYRSRRPQTSMSLTPPISPDSTAGSEVSARGNETISACVRIRPLNEAERHHGQEEIWTYDNNTIGPIASNTITNQTYEFDQVFGPDSNATSIYDRMIKDMTRSTMEGIHGVIFAYGQTASGKTFTTLGTENNPGVLPLAVEDMFNYIQQRHRYLSRENSSNAMQKPEREFLLRASYLEIYNEVIRDLLEPKNHDLRVFDHPVRGSCVRDAKEEVVVSPAQVLDLIRRGEENRKFDSTHKNWISSRSHTIFRIIIESRERGSHDLIRTEEIPDDLETTRAEDAIGCVRLSTLTVTDLAGSERVPFVGVEALNRRKEHKHINKSLFTLGQVIHKISSGTRRGHVPYRESKLTRLLQTSLGGSAKAVVIATVSPARIHSEETLATILFARSAMSVTNKPTVNEVLDASSMLFERAKEVYDIKLKLAANLNSKKIANDPEGKVDPTNVLLKRKNKDTDLYRGMLTEKLDWMDKILINASWAGLTTKDRGALQFLRKRYANQKELKGPTGSFKPNDEHYYVLTERVKILEEEVRNKQGDVDELMDEVDALNTKEAKTKAKLVSAEEEIQKKSETIQSLNDTLEEKFSEIDRKSKEIEELNRRLEEKDREFENELKAQAQLQKEWNDRFDDQNNEIDFLKSDLNNKRREIQRLRQHGEEQEEALADRDDKISLLEQQSTPLFEQVEEQNHHLKLVSGEIEALKASLADKDELTGILMAQLNKLKGDIKTKEENIVNWSQKLQNAKRDVKPVEERLRHLLGDLSRMDILKHPL